MDENKQALFDAALGRFLDGEGEPGDGELIARTLQESPELMRMVSGLLAVDDWLRQQAEPRPEAFAEGVAARIEAETSGAQFLERVEAAIGERSGRPAWRRQRWLPWACAAAAACMAVVGWWPGRTRAGARGGAIGGVPVGREVLALLVNEAEAKFADGAAPDAVSFSKGRYVLVHGVAHLRFRNGADVVVVAPARFVIDDVLRVRMEDGSLRALVPASAHGFVVLAPGVRFRDLGTEFGVTVTSGTGQSKLHVFDGEVEVFREGEASPKATITQGQSVSVTQGVLNLTSAPDDGQFPTPGEISLKRWSAGHERMRRDPNLVFCFPFLPDATSRETLTSDAAGGVQLTGRIHGAEWVTGRWPGKSALQFEHPGDGVTLEIPGEFEAVTLAAWLKIERLEFTMNVLLSSVGWREGGIQLQLDRRGDPAPTSVFSVPKRKPLWTRTPIPTGRWVHWAVTIERKSGSMLHYLNGNLIGAAQVAPGSLLKPGSCQLGRWEPDNKAPDVRDFRGRIDEFAMWRVALTPAQLAELADAGMPVELPEFKDRTAQNPRGPR